MQNTFQPSSSRPPHNPRPTPNRTLRQPFTLDVADRESKASAASSSRGHGVNGTSAALSDQQTLRKTLNRKVELQRKTERWMDLLMEETVDQATFKKASVYLQPHQYLEILHERHLNSHCSYPLCPNPPKRPYNSQRRISISTIKRQIKEIEGNPEDGYCSKQCRVRSGWIEKGLVRDGEPIWLRSGKGKGKGKGDGVELMEELEERGEVVWDTKEKMRIVSTAKEEMNEVTEIEGDGPEEDQSQSSVIPQARDGEKPPPAISETVPTLAPAPPSTPSKVSELLANLIIHERPTPSTPPKAPSLTPVPTRPTPSPSALITPPTPAPTSAPSSAPPKRAPSSSMLSTSTTRLASTLITASKSLSGAVNSANQLGGESEGEEDWEEDWEKEMGWGDEGDEEFKRLFEEARMARELLEGEGSGSGQ